MLGEGGMGAVYEAVQEGLARKVALKVLHPHLSHVEELRGRFAREARVVAMLGHPNVVQINDFQTNEGEPPFLVMELLHGENLRDVLKRSRTPSRSARLPSERVAYIAVQVLSALDAAHKQGIVHRDIKPDNIFLERTSVQSDIVKLLDFGVAKLIGEEEDGLKLTRAGLVVGTLSYMSPEQASGDELDGRADLYSLAAVMYLALAGRKPFEGATTEALVRAIMTERPARLECDETLSDIVIKALSKRAADRYASAAEMACVLRPFARVSDHDAPASSLVTVRTPATAIDLAAVDEAPKTVQMAMTPDSGVPRTTPLPPPETQRSSFYPPAAMEPSLGAVAHLPAAPPRVRRKRSAAPWIASGALVFIVLAAFGGTFVLLSHTTAAPSAIATTTQAPVVSAAKPITTTALPVATVSMTEHLAPLHPVMTATATPVATHAKIQPSAMQTMPPPPRDYVDDPFSRR